MFCTIRKCICIYRRRCGMFFWIHGDVDSQCKDWRVDGLAVWGPTDSRWISLSFFFFFFRNVRYDSLLLNQLSPFPQVTLASLDHLNLQLSACGFSLHKDPDKNFIFRVSYTGCLVQQQVRHYCKTNLAHTVCTDSWHLTSQLGLVVTVVWLYCHCSAQLPHPHAESSEKDQSIQRQTSQFHNDVPCGFSIAQQRTNPVWPRVYSGNCWLDFIVFRSAFYCFTVCCCIFPFVVWAALLFWKDLCVSPGDQTSSLWQLE